MLSPRTPVATDLSDYWMPAFAGMTLDDGAPRSNDINALIENKPASGRRRPPRTPKGRQVDPRALEDVRALLGERPRRRDLLIEHLHLIQDRYGYLSAAHLAALAQEMKLALAEVYEVATFYAHFDVVKEGEAPPRRSPCACATRCPARWRAPNICCAICRASSGREVRVVRAPCMGACDRAPVCAVGHVQVLQATLDSVAAAAARSRTHIRYAEEFRCLSADGGYALLKECLAGKRTREDLIKIVSDAGLRGLGGAGFPTGRKWSLVRAEPAPRLMAVNADEGEPGTFKDRYYLEQDPHRFIEGMLIAAWVVEAPDTYIYFRDEYPELRLCCPTRSPRSRTQGCAAHQAASAPRRRRLYLRRRIRDDRDVEGKRGLPRHRPPYVAQVGLFGRPTLEQNVETLFWIRDMVEKGAAWLTSQGRHERKGFRSFSVSGRVKKPGVVLAPAGVTASELSTSSAAA